MNNFSEWELCGKHGNGTFFSDEQVKPLLDIVDELAYVWYSPEVGGEYLRSFTTVYRSSYEEVTDAIAELSKAMPNAVFCLQYYDSDTEIHRRACFSNGSREEVDVRIVYDLPKNIPCYDVPCNKNERIMRI